MILATSDDYEYPHIDWVCATCGSVYVSSGKPDTDYCPGGDYPASWRPNDDQIEDYIDFLESLKPDDGLVICGFGPAPLMGYVESVGDRQLTTVSIDSPARVVEWEAPEDAAPSISFRQASELPAVGSQVYHVESVDVQFADGRKAEVEA